jgi:hypothetical protein
MSKVSNSNDPPLRDEEKKLGMGEAIDRNAPFELIDT